MFIPLQVPTFICTLLFASQVKEKPLTCMSTSMVTASDPTSVKIHKRQHTHKKLTPKGALYTQFTTRFVFYSMLAKTTIESSC